MSDNLIPESNENNSEELQTAPQTEAVGFSDIFVGALSAPLELFGRLKEAKLTTGNWLIPLIVLVLAVVISSTVMMTNPEIRRHTITKSMERTEKYLKDLVAQGKISATDAEAQLQKTEEQMENIGKPMALVFQGVSIIVVTFIIFFIITGYFYGLSKFFLGAKFSYKVVLIAYGISMYIGLIDVFVSLGISLFFGKPTDSSVAGLIGYENKDILQFFLSKLNVFSIWSYSLLALGMYHLRNYVPKNDIFGTGILQAENAEVEESSTSLVTYFILVFGSWIGWSLLWFIISKNVSFLSNFG